jgi:hypothetical protein
MSDPLPTPLLGEIELYDSLQPGLKDATYQLELHQNLGAPEAEVPALSQQFTVAGPRFAVDPADIHTTFPPNGAMGKFAEVLAHVVFTKRVLPWERGIPELADKVPWMALLVFADGELQGPKEAGNYAHTVKVSELIATATGVRKPKLLDVTPAQAAMSCQTITIPAELFAQVVPTAAELALLAHVRNINTEHKPLLGVKEDGAFSVVVASRFPAPGSATLAAKNIAHLVSLEGFGDLLGGNAPVAPTQGSVELVSLASWTFSTLSDPAQTFSGLATNLSREQSGAERSAESLLLKLEVPPPADSSQPGAAAQTRLSEGYAALGYHARSGEDAFAWFRGPLTPTLPGSVPRATPFASAEQAMVFDPHSGVFDHSLAAAWQIGRSLALADGTFATLMMRVRRRANQALEQRLHSPIGHVQGQLAGVLAGGLAELVREASQAGSGPHAVQRRNAPRSRTAETLRAALAQAPLSTPAEDPDVEAIVDWLAVLRLLYPVPFTHLVPDARMLPGESLRFFYLDTNWLAAMTDGALSVGVATSREAAVQQALTVEWEQHAEAAAVAYRAKQLNQTPPVQATGPSSGMLIRSALISGWPGLTVQASAGGQPLALLRSDKLAPNVLLVLFNGVPDTVTLGEPQEGLEFGVDDTGQIVLRQLTAPLGTEISKLKIYDPQVPGTSLSTLRAGGHRVLNLDAGAKEDLLGLIAKGISTDRSQLGPADLAVQMMKAPEQVTFS